MHQCHFESRGNICFFFLSLSLTRKGMICEDQRRNGPHQPRRWRVYCITMSCAQQITVKRTLIVGLRSHCQHFARLSERQRKASVTVQISTECSKKKRENHSVWNPPRDISSSVNMSVRKFVFFLLPQVIEDAHSRSLLGRKKRICCSDDVTALTPPQKK